MPNANGTSLVLLIPFPLLWKLKVTSRQKTILAAIFLLPSIPIVFAILKLVLVNPTKSGPIDMFKFSIFYMLENSTGTCPPFPRTQLAKSIQPSSQHAFPPSGSSSTVHHAITDQPLDPALDPLGPSITTPTPSSNAFASTQQPSPLTKATIHSSPNKAVTALTFAPTPTPVPIHPTSYPYRPPKCA